jgi:hypothetical protein
VLAPGQEIVKREPERRRKAREMPQGFSNLWSSGGKLARYSGVKCFFLGVLYQRIESPSCRRPEFESRTYNFFWEMKRGAVKLRWAEALSAPLMRVNERARTRSAAITH